MIAVFAVVCIHCEPFAPSRTGSDSPIFSLLYTAISETSRFAVPFFFCTSGYFWGKKIRAGAVLWPTTRKMLTRLVAIYLFWCAVYLLPLDFAGMWQFGSLAVLKNSYLLLLGLGNPFRLALEGDAVHLWFLPALFYALLITYF
ncbi:MAG: acyltransferase family protein, partial [Terracidiphilus sp.]